jgi:hypothetical protein
MECASRQNFIWYPSPNCWIALEKSVIRSSLSSRINMVFTGANSLFYLDKALLRPARNRTPALVQQGISIQGRVFGSSARNFSMAIESCWYVSVFAICSR